MPLSEVDDRRLVGGKAHVLGRLRRDGFAVPPGFVITENAPVLTGAGQEAEQDGSECHPLTHAELTAACRRWIGHGRAVAVRSSAVAEDGPQRSFAGQFTSFLDVCGIEAIIDAVARCRASGRDGRAERYRTHLEAESGAEADEPSFRQMPVLVQEMVRADWAGVLFSVDPVRPDPAVLVVELVPQSAALVCDGSVDPLRYRVDRLSLSVLDGPAADGGITPDSPLVAEVARVGLALEQALGGPQDVEWAAQDGERPRVSILQSRAITTLPSTAGQKFGVADVLRRL
ncbi:PEP/pyruvate-binding domain-containing protein [Kribbella sp. DT2]|uniref:PEP/pyruvate-binding domain-containing protein n=1 Tax=Kribbella sp. DT2 TaxID=3393427 RepID=UPI003CF16E0D